MERPAARGVLALDEQSPAGAENPNSLRNTPTVEIEEGEPSGLAVGQVGVKAEAVTEIDRAALRRGLIEPVGGVDREDIHRSITLRERPQIDPINPQIMGDGVEMGQPSPEPTAAPCGVHDHVSGLEVEGLDHAHQVGV